VPPIKQNSNHQKERRHGRCRLPHHACDQWADPDRALGDFLVSAEIIPFVPRSRDRVPDETTPRFRSPARTDDLTMDHADTAPCEYSPWSVECHDDGRPV
jgi:hypothetical protein